MAPEIDTRVQILAGFYRGTYATVRTHIGGTSYGLQLDGQSTVPASYDTREFRVIDAPALTPFKLRLLMLVRMHEVQTGRGITPTEAAHLLWHTDSRLRAGRELHKLMDLDLVMGLIARDENRPHVQDRWIVTAKGIDTLAAYRG